MTVDTSGVLAGKTLTAIGTGMYYACAQDGSGAAYCWGANRQGQDGNGTITGTRVPVAVAFP
ncbi:MAG TPA: hypothetical protein DHU96_06455 [Actinobacteria bacterium]|nr:hypothetical protein [Actinomycetota bacterium]